MEYVVPEQEPGNEEMHQIIGKRRTLVVHAQREKRLKGGQRIKSIRSKRAKLAQEKQKRKRCTDLVRY